MKPTVFAIALFALSFIPSTQALFAEDPAPRPACVIIKITCKGDNDACYSYTENGQNYTVGGTVVSIEVEDVRHLCTPGEIDVTNVFLHDPGNPATGRGYVGVSACVDPVNRTAEIPLEGVYTEYTTFSTWLSAASLH